MRLIAAAASVLALCSCSSLTAREPASPPVIRYLNLAAVYEYVFNRSRDAVAVKQAMDRTSAKIREVERALDDPRTDHVALLDEYRSLKKEREELKEKGLAHKRLLLKRIDLAVRNVAAKCGADFVYTIGTELIYARKEYDVTEDVLKELERLEDRFRPEAR